MKISTKLVLNFGIFFIFSLAVLAGIFFMTSHIEKSIQNNNLIEQLLDGFNDLNIVTYSYVLYPGERPRVQWELKHTSLGNLLKRVNSEKTAVLDRMGENHRLAKTLFDDLVRKFQDQHSQVLGSQDSEVKERITSQLIARTQMMRADALVLKHASNVNLLSTQREWFWILTGIILIMLASVTWVSFFLKRRITGSLSTLTQGTEIIRGGNFDYRTGIASKDEIGRLSRSFDDMAENLKNTLVSRDALQREVEERKRAEDALRESGQRWATTLASIGDAVIATDVAGGITFMNAIAESLTGWALREASMKPVAEVFNIINEQTRQKVENPVIKVLEKGNIVGLANHTLLVRRDGTKIPIDDSGAPIKDKDDKVTGVVLVFRDITDRKRADEALKESEQKYRLLVEHAPAGIYEIDFVEKRIKTVNEAASKMLGFTVAEILAMNPMDILDPDSRPAFLDRLRKAQAGEALSEAIEYKGKRKDGSELWGILHSKFKYLDGRIVGAFVVAHDITERKRAADILRTTVQRFFTVLSSMYAGILLVADNGRIEFANQAFCDLFDLKGSAAELTGLTSAETIERIKNAYLRPNEEVTRIREIIGGGQPVKGEEIAMRGDRTCLRDFIPIYVNGKTFGRLWVHLEITERKRTEEALAAAIERASWLGRFPEENPNPVMRVASDGAILYCNPAAKKLAEWGCELGQSLVRPILKVFGKAMVSGVEAQEDMELGGRWYSIWVVPISEECYANVYGRDITERKQTEEKLRLTQTSIDGAAEMVAWFTPDGRLHYVNDATCRALGYSREELLQMTALDFSPGFTWEQYQAHWQEVRERKSFTLEPTHRRKDGSEYPAEVLVNYVVYGGQEYIFAYGWDITERRQAEEALRKAKDELEERVQERTEDLRKTTQILNAVSQNSPDLLFAKDSQGRLTYASESTLRVLGKSAAEVLGKTDAEFHPDLRLGEAVMENDRIVRETRRPLVVEELTQLADGSVRIYLSKKIPWTADDGTLLGTLGIAVDITERKQTETELKERTEELAKSRERLQNLSSQLLLAQEKERKRVAVELHDGLLSELAAMKFILEGKVSLLKQGKLVDPGEFKRVSDILGIVMKEARRIMNNLHPSVLDELGLIAAMSWLCAEYQKAYPHIKVETKIEVTEGDISESVRVVIYRVLQEALNNFAKHGKGDRVELSLSKSDGTFEFIIRDNGQGFDVEKAPKGLGLESMRERVELSGGEFRIESNIGQGTTIRAIWSRS